MTNTPIEKQKEYRRKWVEALRSGKYEQTAGELRSENGFCCLGVFCDLVKDEVKGEWSESGYYHVGYDRNREFLPETLREMLGLETDNGCYSAYGDTSLTKINDEGKSFSEIADIIESEPEGLFVESSS